MSLPFPQPKADTLGKLVEFCRQHGPATMKEWPQHTIEEYLLFHLAHGSAVYVDDGDGITGLGVGWKTKLANLETHWQTHDPRGDCFYFADLIATTKAALGRIMFEFHRRFPEWSSLRLFGRRNGRLMEWTPRMMRRLWLHTLKGTNNHG